MSTISVVGNTPAFQAGTLSSNLRWYTAGQETTMTDKAFASGRELAHWFDGLDEDQIQPNGIDLTAGKLYTPGNGRITKNGKTVGARVELEPTEDFWIVDEPVIVEYGEEIYIPDDMIGFVFPRSTLMRNGCELHTAVWDSGYRGIGEGLLVPHVPIDIEQGARIAQIVMARSDPGGTYNGDYQHERLDEF